MIGGAVIYEDVAGGVGVAGADTLGGVVGRATSLANATGVSVLNQAHHWLTSPQSEAPVGLPSMSVHFHRFGSGARIALACSAAFVTAVQGGLITQQVSWDFTAQQLIPYNATPGALPVRIIRINVGNSKVITGPDANGGYHWTPSGSAALCVI